jgi:hypothetical protein
MPEYLYIDENEHTQTVTHPVVFDEPVTCVACGSEMWRKPQSFTVTWGGLRPSQGELHPEIKNLVDTAPERRAVFDKEHEEHERNS